jgi:hypothetical protein
MFGTQTQDASRERFESFTYRTFTSGISTGVYPQGMQILGSMRYLLFDTNFTFL